VIARPDGRRDQRAAFTRLPELPAFHLDNHLSVSNYSTLLQQVDTMIAYRSGHRRRTTS
jgi:hypothetical protein